MDVPQIVVGGFNHTDSSSFFDAVSNFVHDRSLFVQIWTWISSHGHQLGDWLRQPHVLALIMVYWITFTVVLILLFAIGFNVPGIGAGTFAAAFQSWAYGGFTPAGGIFATMTSMAMLGYLMPIHVGVAAVLAGVVTLIAWGCGVGH